MTGQGNEPGPAVTPKEFLLKKIAIAILIAAQAGLTA